MARKFVLTKKTRKPNDIVTLQCIGLAHMYPKLGLRFSNGRCSIAWGKIVDLYENKDTTQQFQEHWMRSFGPSDEFKGKTPRSSVVEVRRMATGGEAVATAPANDEEANAIAEQSELREQHEEQKSREEMDGVR